MSTSVVTIRKSSLAKVFAALVLLVAAAVIFYEFVITGASGSAAEQRNMLVQVENSSERELAIRAFELSNAERMEAGLAPYTWDETLHEACLLRASEITTVFSHTRPDGSSCFTALEEADISLAGAAENIASGFPGADGAVSGWMNSEGHRANIMGEHTYMAVGVVKNPESSPYNGYAFAQLFFTGTSPTTSTDTPIQGSRPLLPTGLPPN